MMAAPGPSSQGVEDMWHVLMAPGETKILSLEQLDDFFRLELIDAGTRVWQPGMSEWLPLSVVAGLEEAPPPARPAPPARAPAPTAKAPYAAPLQPMPAAFAAPVFTTPESLRPHVMADLPAAPQSGSRLGGVLIGFAMLAALGITLFRNDMLRELAQSIGQETAYTRLESAVGGPGFGTPRAIEELALIAPSPSISDPEPLTAAALPSQPTLQEERPVATPAQAQPAATEPAKAASLESLVATQLKPAKVAPAPARPASARPPRSAEPQKSLGFKGSSNRYDPLNDKL